MSQYTEEGKQIHYLREAIQDRDKSNIKAISSAMWKRRRRKHIYDANNMILEAGATGCKPLDRRTRYVDIGAILGNEDPTGVLTDHFKNIYTATPTERREDRDKQECLLNHVIDPT